MNAIYKNDSFVILAICVLFVSYILYCEFQKEKTTNNSKKNIKQKTKESRHYDSAKSRNLVGDTQRVPIDTFVEHNNMQNYEEKNKFDEIYNFEEEDKKTNDTELELYSLDNLSEISNNSVMSSNGLEVDPMGYDQYNMNNIEDYDLPLVKK